MRINRKPRKTGHVLRVKKSLSLFDDIPIGDQARSQILFLQVMEVLKVEEYKLPQQSRFNLRRNGSSDSSNYDKLLYLQRV
jgi:hypothetical protein